MQNTEQSFAKTRPSVFGYMGLALLFGVFLFMAFRYRPKPIIDDAAINFRYVDQITAGHGIVYNYPGPHVYGASSLPYTLLLSVLHFVGLNSEIAALGLNVVCLATVCLLLFQLCTTRTELTRARMPGIWALIPCFLALFHNTVIVWITQGLESGFHLLLCVLPIWFYERWLYERKKQVWCGLFIALAVMNKLDAVSLGAAIVLYDTSVLRKLPWRLIGIAIVAYLPWLLFTTLYFGNPLPMSLMAKLLNEFAANGNEFLVHYKTMFWLLILGLGAVLLSKAAFIRILALWFVCYVLLYNFVSRSEPFPWYFFPSDFTLCFLAGTSLAILMCRLTTPIEIEHRQPGRSAEKENLAVLMWKMASPPSSPSDRANGQPAFSEQSALVRRRITGVLSAILLIWMANSTLGSSREALRNTRIWADNIERDRVDIGLFLRRVAAPNESVLSVHGWIQYLSKLKVYDYSGINDPDMVRMVITHRVKMYLLERRPTYLVNHAYVPPDELRNEYVLIAQFTRTEKVHFPIFNLWARKDSAAMKVLAGRTLPLVFPAGSHNTAPNPQVGQ